MSRLRTPIFLISLTTCLTFLPGLCRAQDPSKTLVVTPIADSPSFAKRALIIGVHDYDHANKLAVTTDDARAFADLMRTHFAFPPEAITLMTDDPDTPDKLKPTYLHLRSAIKTLLNGVNESSEVVIFFSGHGTRFDNQDWLVPQDGLPDDVSNSCINYDQIKEELETKRPHRALLIVDACRNLQEGKETTSSGFGGSKGLYGPQIAELLSCLPKEVSKEGKPEDFHQSVFTHYLLQGLSGDREALSAGTNDVTFDSLKLYVAGKVSQYVSSKFGESQNPDGRATLGAMVLARGGVSLPITGQPGGAAGGHHLGGASRPEHPQLGDVWVNPKDGAQMVFIPAGPFLIGDDDDAIKDFSKNTSNNPRHTVILSGYWIYKNVVTVGMYKKYCQEMGKPMPPEPVYRDNHFNPNWSKEDHPIVNVSWNDAKAYCDWAGVALPTEAQWEKAARGTEGRKFPWGDEFDQRKLWCSRSAPGGVAGTASVGSYGMSPYGLSDMAGNVWQWCADWYDANFWSSRSASGGQDPQNQSVGDQKARVVRGGSWSDTFPDFFRTAHRFWDSPDYRLTYLGFRAALTP